MLRSHDIPEAAMERPTAGRPRKLTREEIVDGAIALVEKHGPDALTMRALGKSLGVQASTLYNYFPSTDHLNQEIGRKLLSAVPLPGAVGEEARGQLLAHFMAMRAVLIRHPDVLDRKPGSVSWIWSLQRLEAQLALLSAAGVAPEQALMVVRVLDVTCITAAQTAREWSAQDFVARRKLLFSGVKPSQLPHVQAVHGLLMEKLPDEGAFRQVMETLIDSLLPQLRARRRKA